MCWSIWRWKTCGRPCGRSEEHTSELQSRLHLVCRLLLEKTDSILVVRWEARGGRGPPHAGWGVGGGWRGDRGSAGLSWPFAAIASRPKCLGETATTESYSLSLHDALPI